MAGTFDFALPERRPSRSMRWIVALVVVLVLGSAAVPVYFLLIEPRLARVEYNFEGYRGPDTGGDPSRYYWYGLFDEFTTRVPLRGREAPRLELVFLLIAVTDLPRGSSFSGGGGGGFTDDGDANDLSYDFHFNSSATEELGLDDDWTREARTLEERYVSGKGTRTHVTIAGKTYDLSLGRVFFVDGHDHIEQIDWAPFEPTPENLDEQVRGLLHVRELMPR